MSKVIEYVGDDAMERLCKDMAADVLQHTDPFKRATVYEDLRLTRKIFIKLPLGWHEVVGFHVIGTTPETVQPLLTMVNR